MNTLKIFLSLFMVFGMVSCNTNEANIPPNILSDHAMIPIMVDIHVVEGARNGALILGDTNGIEDYYDKIYRKHHITEQQFKESFDFYSSNPDIFIPIYEKVLDSLKRNGEHLARKGVNLEYD